MLSVAITGRFDAGCLDVLSAIAGPHASDASKGRLTMRAGVVPVPDPRLERLTSTLKVPKRIPAEIAYWAFPNDALGASTATAAEWVGRLRLADVLLLVVPIAAGGDVVASIPAALDDLLTELALLDLAVVEAGIQRTETKATGGPRVERRAAQGYEELLARVHDSLEAGNPVAGPAYSPAELSDLRGFGLFAMKPVAVALNCAEPAIRPVQAWLAGRPKATWAVVSGSLEAELSGLDPADALAFRADAGFSDSALARVTGAVLAAADQIRFYTGNERQANAWMIGRGASAVDAAGAIHSDLAKGFVRIDVAPVEEVIAAGGLAPLRATGHLRQEGRAYLVADGDFLLVHFTR